MRRTAKRRSRNGAPSLASEPGRIKGIDVNSLAFDELSGLHYSESCNAYGPPPHPDDIYRPAPGAEADRKRQLAIAAHDRFSAKVASRMQPNQE